MPDCAHRDHRDWYEDSRRECYERTRERLRGAAPPWGTTPAVIDAFAQQRRTAVKLTRIRKFQRHRHAVLARRAGWRIRTRAEWVRFNGPEYLYGAVGDCTAGAPRGDFGLTIERHLADGTVTILARILVAEWAHAERVGRYARRLVITFHAEAAHLEGFAVGDVSSTADYVELAQERAWRLLREAGVVT